MVVRDCKNFSRRSPYATGHRLGHTRPFFDDLLGGFLHCRIREPLNHPTPRRFEPLERVHTCRVPLNPSSEPRMS